MCGWRTRRSSAAGVVPLTQFGRMCAALGITIIAASSPQAKGRVERNHGTHQDRLVKKLRRLGDRRTTSAANAFPETTYWPAHNARFAQPPAAADGLPPPPADGSGAGVFRLEERAHGRPRLGGPLSQSGAATRPSESMRPRAAR